MIDEAQGEKMLELIGEAAAGDSVGGVVECGAVGLPVGLGEHMFAGMENRIAHLAFGISALKGIEFGADLPFPICAARKRTTPSAPTANGFTLQKQQRRHGRRYDQHGILSSSGEC